MGCAGGYQRLDKTPNLFQEMHMPSLKEIAVTALIAIVAVAVAKKLPVVQNFV